MDNLREDFRSWLVGQGISDKLINNKSSTVYEYIRQLDVLSKKLYNSDDWDLLIKNATVLLFFYLLCGKAKYRNNNYTFDELLQYLKKSDLTEIPSYVLAEFAKYKFNEASLLQILDNKTFNEKAGVSFLKFYQFMYEEKKIFDIPLQDIKDASFQILRIFTRLKLKPISGCSPARIEMSSQNVSQTVTVEELTNFLDCSRSTVERLLKKGLFELNVDSINSYLMAHYHPSTLTRILQPDFLNEKWYTIAEVADFLNCSQTTVKRLIKRGDLSFTDYSARKTKILGYDLQFHKK